MKQQIAIVDYGVGNLHSVAKAMALVAPDAEVIISHDHAVIDASSRIIFPGVGSMADCMEAIHQHQLPKLLQQQIQRKPVMGICVGMQALMQSSSEHSQDIAGLGYFNANVKWFNDELKVIDQQLKVPHMGWNSITMSDHELWNGLDQQQRFYFVHSYFAPIDEFRSEEIAASCEYGVEFAAAVIKKNLFAVQFHPEKSHDAGLQLLRNFVNWDGSL